MCVYKAADYRENQQDMQEHLILRQSVIKDTDTAYHRDKVKELAEEYRKRFPTARTKCLQRFSAPLPDTALPEAAALRAVSALRKTGHR